MLFDGVAHSRYRKIVFSRLDGCGWVVANVAHHAIYILEFSQGWPVRVSISPIALGCEPYGERFSEVFVRMLLRVPAEYVANEVVREWVSAITVAIWSRVWPERFPPIGSVVESVGVVECVTRFVAHVPHRVIVGLDAKGEIIL